MSGKERARLFRAALRESRFGCIPNASAAIYQSADELEFVQEKEMEAEIKDRLDLIKPVLAAKVKMAYGEHTAVSHDTIFKRSVAEHAAFETKPGSSPAMN